MQHLSVINHIVAQHNTVILSTTVTDLFGMPKGPCNVQVDTLNFECGTGLRPAISALRYGISDPENRLHGSVTWHKLHAIDEIAKLDDRLSSNPWEVTVVTEDGQHFTHPFRNHGRTGSEHFGISKAPLIARGALQYGKLGNADVGIVDAAICRDVLLDIYSKTTENFCLAEKEIPEALWRT